MTPQQAAMSAFTIARRERLPMARMAEVEAGVAGAADWFAANLTRFFAGNAAAPYPSNTISNAQLRRYIAWMRGSR